MSDDFICSRQREETRSRISDTRPAEQDVFDEGPYRDTGRATPELSGSCHRHHRAANVKPEWPPGHPPPQSGVPGVMYHWFVPSVQCSPGAAGPQPHPRLHPRSPLRFLHCSAIGLCVRHGCSSPLPSVPRNTTCITCYSMYHSMLETRLTICYTTRRGDDADIITTWRKVGLSSAVFLSSHTEEMAGVIYWAPAAV